jgi:hypothetical protein
MHQERDHMTDLFRQRRRDLPAQHTIRPWSAPNAICLINPGIFAMRPSHKDTNEKKERTEKNSCMTDIIIQEFLFQYLNI